MFEGYTIKLKPWFWFLATVTFGLLSWGDLISSDFRQFDFSDTI